MKLEVGKFVRTKDGTIGKIIAIDLAKPRQEKYPDHPSKKYWRDKILISCYKGWITTQNIIKASHNIIDLIEVGDYVNGYKVIEIEKDYKFIDNEIRDILWLDNKRNNAVWKETIKSIVAKEQMEQMAYKVRE